MKRVLTFVLALALVFGTVSFAVAAPVDVEGTDYEGAVARLGGLGVLKGYPDGTFKPENSITRAEFAVVVVKLLGLADAAEYAGGATDFSDVPADHWASGYVNIAVNRGIIKGYPDGTFAPNNPVNYSEAVTMLVRVLGYGPAADDEGTWPANYLAKAAELGVTDDVNFYGYAPATRGNVAIMADNSLEVPMMVRVGYGDEATYEVPKDDEQITLLNDKIKAKTVKAVLDKTHLVDCTTVDEDELAVLEAQDDDGVYNDAEVYEIADDCDVNFEDYLAEEVTLWLNDDDEVFFIERETDESDLVEGVIDEVDTAEVTVIDADGDDKDYDFATAVKVYINLRTGDGSAYDEGDLEPGMYVKAVLNDDGDIETVVATKWSIGVVDEVDVGDEEIDLKDKNVYSDEPNNNLDLEDMEYDFDLGDLEEDMIVLWYSVLTDDDDDVYKYFIEAYDETLVGTLEEYKSGDYVVIDDEEYDLAYDLVGDVTSDDDFTDLLGDDVKVYFGKDGKVVMAELDEAAEEEKDYALVVDVSEDEDRYGNTTPYIKLLTASGDIIEYAVAEDAVLKEGTTVVDRDVDADDYATKGYVGDVFTEGTDANGSDCLIFGASSPADPDNVLPGEIDMVTVAENKKEFTTHNRSSNTLVKYSLNNAGEIDELEIVGDIPSDETATGVEVDKDDKQLGSKLFAVDDSLFFDAYNEEVISFSKLGDGDDYFIKYVDDSADIEVAVVYSNNYVEDTEYAIYLSKSDIADDQYKVKVMMNGEEQYFNTDMSSTTLASTFGAAYKGEVFSVDFTDGDITDAEEVGVVANESFIDTISDVKVSKGRIEFATEGYYLFADDIQVYEYTLKDEEAQSAVDEVEAAETNDLDDGQLVNVILDDDGYVEYIFIIDDDDDNDVIDDVKFQ